MRTTGSFVVGHETSTLQCVHGDRKKGIARHKMTVFKLNILSHGHSDLLIVSRSPAGEGHLAGQVRPSSDVTWASLLLLYSKSTVEACRGYCVDGHRCGALTKCSDFTQNSCAVLAIFLATEMVSPGSTRDTFSSLQDERHFITRRAERMGRF